MWPWIMLFQLLISLLSLSFMLFHLFNRSTIFGFNFRCNTNPWKNLFNPNLRYFFISIFKRFPSCPLFRLRILYQQPCSIHCSVYFRSWPALSPHTSHFIYITFIDIKMITQVRLTRGKVTEDNILTL